MSNKQHLKDITDTSSVHLISLKWLQRSLNQVRRRTVVPRFLAFNRFLSVSICKQECRHVCASCITRPFNSVLNKVCKPEFTACQCSRAKEKKCNIIFLQLLRSNCSQKSIEREIIQSLVSIFYKAISIGYCQTIVGG